MKKRILYQPYYMNPQMIEGLYAGCRQFDLLLSIIHPGMEKQVELRSYDGLLSVNVEQGDAMRTLGGKAVCSSLLTSGTAGTHFDAIVACDESSIGRIGAEYFLRKGHWNFACALAPLREQAFVETLRHNGQHSVSVFHKPKKSSGMMTKQVEFLKSLPKPCAFLVQTVQFGEFWNEALVRAKLRIPEDLAVLGIDDLEYICNLLDPPLSSIDTNNYERGFRACEVLAKLLDNEPVEPLTLIAPQKRVIERASSDFYPVSSGKLRQMIRFADEHVSEGLSVRRLAETFALTMPMVYQLFQRHLRNSPKRFLVELQLKRAEELLKHGDLKMEDVARESGFATVKSFYDFFHEYHDTTPKEWCCRFR